MTKNKSGRLTFINGGFVRLQDVWKQDFEGRLFSLLSIIVSFLRDARPACIVSEEESLARSVRTRRTRGAEGLSLLNRLSPACLPLCLSVCLPACLAVCLALLVCLSVCLSA